MNILIATLAFPTGALGLLFKVAVVCIIAWGIFALVKWAGWTIPQPIVIVFICLLSILVIYWMFQLFSMLL